MVIGCGPETGRWLLGQLERGSVCVFGRQAQQFHWLSKTTQTREMERRELEGCGASGRPRKVLDRPKELGGEQVQGTNTSPG